MKNKMYVFLGLTIIMVFLGACSIAESQKESNGEIGKNKITSNKNPDEDVAIDEDDDEISETEQERPAPTRYMVRLPEILFSENLQNEVSQANEVTSEIEQVKAIFKEFRPFYPVIAEHVVVLPQALLQQPAMLYSQFQEDHHEHSKGSDGTRKLFKKTTWPIELRTRMIKLVEKMVPVGQRDTFADWRPTQNKWDFSPKQETYRRFFFQFLPGEEKERGIRVQTAWNTDNHYELYWTYHKPGQVKDKIRWRQTDKKGTQVVFWHLPREYESYFLKQTQDGHRVTVRVKAHDKKTQGVHFYVQRGNISYNGYADAKGIYIDSDKSQLFALNENGKVVPQNNSTYKQIKNVYQKKLAESPAPKNVDLIIPSDEAEEEN